jgi:hypothetical protein
MPSQSLKTCVVCSPNSGDGLTDEFRMPAFPVRFDGVPSWQFGTHADIVHRSSLIYAIPTPHDRAVGILVETRFGGTYRASRQDVHSSGAMR